MKSIIILNILFILVLNIGVSLAIDISNKHLVKYKGLSNLLGTHNVTLTQNTPPSTKSVSWYLNIYDSSNKDSKDDNSVHVENCPAALQICGLTSVSLPSESKEFITEVFSFSNSLNPLFDFSVDNEILINLNGANWGTYNLDASLKFICSDSDSGLLLDNWDYSKVEFSWKTPYACLDSDSSKPGDKDKNKDKNTPNDDDDSKNWGFFTWMFILLVLILATYIIFNLWINNSSGRSNSTEFINDLVDSIIESLLKLPNFIKEIFNKFSNNGNRSGYSAV